MATGSGKGSQNLLSIIGGLASVAGPLVFGPDATGIDFGAPFKAAAQSLADEKFRKDTMDLLASNPHTAPLVAHIPSIINAGGIANNADLVNHPEVQQYMNKYSGYGNAGAMPTAPQPSPLVDAVQTAGTPAPAAPAQAPVGPTTTSAPSTPTDYTSPEFLSKLAAVDPASALKVVTAKATQNPDDVVTKQLHELLLGKAVQDYQTPTDKLAAKQKEQSDLRLENTKDNRAKVSDLDRRSLDAVDQSISHIQALPETIASTMPLGGQLAKISPLAQSYAYPDLTRIKEGLQAAKIQFGSALKGARVNPSMIDTLTASFPDPTSNPELWPQMRTQVLSRMRLAQLAQQASLAKGGKTNEGISIEHGGTPVMDPETQQNYEHWIKAFQDYGPSAQKSPTFQDLTSKLGLDGIFINPTK